MKQLTVASADTLSLSSGSISIASASTDQRAVRLDGRDLEGTGNVTVTGALTWSDGGTIAGTGQTIAKGAVNICTDGSQRVYLVNGSFTNDGTATVDGYIEPSGGASFTNAAGATFNAATNGYFLVAGDSSTLTFNNAGTFNAQAGAGNIATDNGVTFTSTGSVSVASGTLYLDDPGGTDTGSFKVAASADARL